MQFGKNGCSTIEVTQFEPMCSYPELSSTSPLALDVPVPAFISPVIPNECACFDFVSKDTATKVVNDCDTTATPKCSVEIKQADPEDCCKGQYTVTPTVEIPCMPFSVEDANVVVTNRTGDASKGIEGDVSFSLRKGCCTLEPEMHVVLPDCIKGYDPTKIGVDQVRYYKRESDGHVSDNYHTLVEMYVDEENCDIYPKINPIELPYCTLPDGVLLAGSFPVDKRGSTVSWELSRTDCNPTIKFDASILDCACFSFKPGSSEVTVTECNTPGRVAASIQRVEGTSCCDGMFEIKTEASIPCIPFSLGDARIDEHTKNGGSDTDGHIVKFELHKSCCTITPKIEVEFPQCIKPYIAPPDLQIEYLDHGVTKWHKLVSIEEDADNCTFYPIINPIELPCPLNNWSQEYTRSLTNLGGTITLKTSVTDCTPSIQLDVVPVNIPVPTFCLCDPAITYTVKYTDDDGEHTPVNKETLDIEARNCTDEYGNYTGCKTFGGNITIDLGKISASGFLSNGDVFKAGGAGTGGGAEDNLYIDGSEFDGDDTWYCGGIGDLKVDLPTMVLSRGQVMRNYGELESAYSGNPLALEIPTDAIQTYIVTDDVDASDMGNALTTRKQICWKSARIEETVTGEGDDAVTTYTRGYAEGVASGNLSIVMPTGIQWHDRGLGFVLSHFQYNSSGILSSFNESGVAALISPAPSVTLTKIYNSDTVNASGLQIPLNDTKVSTGLRVKAGDGLRIYDTNAPTATDPIATSDTDHREGARFGDLEVQYGYGLRVVKTAKTGSVDATYTNYPSNTAGALTIHYGAGLRMRTNDNTENPTYESGTSTDTGALELNYGPGMNAAKTVVSSKITEYEDNPQAIQGAIVPNCGRGLRVYGLDSKTASNETTTSYKDELEIDGCTKDFAFHSTSEKLVLNDISPGNEKLQNYMLADGTTKIQNFARDRGYEFSIPVFVPHVEWLKAQGYTTSPDYSTSGTPLSLAVAGMSTADLLSALSGFSIIWLKITQSGLVYAVSSVYTGASVGRHASNAEDT